MPVDVNDPDVQAVIQAAIASYVASHPPQRGPAGEQGPPGEAAGESGTPRWNASELGFFFPDYDDKPITADGTSAMEHSNKETFFRDVHLFLEHANDYARLKGAELVRNNLWTCFKGTALTWWVSEASPETKRLVKFGSNLDEWSAALIKRFKQPTNVALDNVLREKYTFKDAVNKREPREYANKILRSAKDAELSDVKNQLDIIYNGIDPELRLLRLTRPKGSLDDFMSDLDEIKYDWWTYASRNTRHGQPQIPNRVVKSERTYQPNGQYTSRQSYEGYQPRSSNFQGPPRYYSSFREYQNNQNNAYPQQFQQSRYQSNSYQPQGQYQYQSRQASNESVRPQQIGAPAVPRMLTSGQPNVSNSPFRPNANANINTGYNNRRFDKNRPARPRVYHNDVDENSSEPIDEEYDQSRGTWHVAENDDAPELDQENADPPEQSTQESHDDTDYYFSSPTVSISCSKCESCFDSRNKLFQHLRIMWDRRDARHQSDKVSALPEQTDCAHNTIESPVEAEACPSTREIIVSSAKPTSLAPGYAFRGYTYATFTAVIGVSPFKSCADSGCPMSIIDRKVLLSAFPDVLIKQMLAPISVRGIGDLMHQTSEFANIVISINGRIGDKQVTARLTIEVHIVDSLRANLLVGNDVMVPNDIVLHPGKGQMIIGSCQNAVIDIVTETKATTPIQRTVRSKQAVTIPPNSIANVPIYFQGHALLPSDRDFLLEPKRLNSLGEAGGVYAHIVDSNMSFVQVRNATSCPTRINSKTKLGKLVEYTEQGCYLVDPDKAPLAAGNATRSQWKEKLIGAAAVAGCLFASTHVPQSQQDTAPKVLLSAPAQTPSLAQAPLLATADNGPYWSDPAAQTQNNTVDQAASAQNEPIIESTSRDKERTMHNGITVYGEMSTAMKLAAVADEFPDIWTDQGVVDIPEDEWMPIPLKDGADPKPSRVYPLGERDRKIIDDTFDKLHDQGKMVWTSYPTKFSYPVFVVWRNLPKGPKGRAVIDIRGLNKITEPDTYPMPLQSDVISAVAGYKFITVVDASGYFHQFRVQVADRHKLTVVSHRGQEQFNVAIMGYKGSPPYVQRQTDRMLRPFRAFARAFVDDIVIFSNTLEEHVSHLRQIFAMFKQRNVSLSPDKSYLGFPSVTLLGQHVDSLGYATSEEKIEAIQSLKFPYSLRDLEIYLGLTGWLRSSIERYAQISEPLQNRKTNLTRNIVGTKGQARKRLSIKTLVETPTEAEMKAYDQIKERFASPIFLTHYDQKRVMYVDLDSSKQMGFAAIVYHIKGDPPLGSIDICKVPRTSVQPIMFLSKLLNTAESNYWPTELEVAGIVWVVKKIRHMIESSHHAVQIITDHSAAVQIGKQTSLTTSNTEKLNLRLVRASQYLQTFNLCIRHKSGKSNTVPDALSRLQKIATPQDLKEKGGVLDALTVDALMTEEVYTYVGTLIEVTDEFKERLVNGYNEDKQWKQIIDMLKSPGTTIDTVETRSREERRAFYLSKQDDNRVSAKAGIQFQVKDNGLLYHVSPATGNERLVIPRALHQDIFKLAHDRSNHGGYSRTLDRLKDTVYIRHVSKHLRTYLMHCPDCRLYQTTRHAPYGSLNPIVTPPIPFHTLAMDFIVELPEIRGMSVLLTMTDKFTKKTMLLPGKDTYGAEDWANIVVTELMNKDWGIPSSIISDRDRKFMSSFWRVIFTKLKVNMITSTAYHPQTDGQSERTNQAVEIAMRFLLSDPDCQDWIAFLPFLSAVMNNSTNATTGFAPNELAYGFRVKDNLNLLHDLPAEDFERMRMVKREEADDAVAFANAMSKIRYDAKHKDISLDVGDKAFLVLHRGYKVQGAHRKLGPQRVGPFPVVRKAGNLAYELKLPSNMLIHPVISVAQLEPAPKDDDPYNRSADMHPPPVENADDSDPENEDRPYEIERFLDKRVTPTGQIKYLVKWKGYGHEHNGWFHINRLGHAQEHIDAFDSVQTSTQENQPQRTTRLAIQAPRPKRGRPKKAVTTPNNTVETDTVPAVASTSAAPVRAPDTTVAVRPSQPPNDTVADIRPTESRLRMVRIPGATYHTPTR